MYIYLVSALAKKYAIVISDRPSVRVTCPREKQRDNQSSCSQTAFTPAGVSTPKSCHHLLDHDQWVDLQVRVENPLMNTNTKGLYHFIIAEIYHF